MGRKKKYPQKQLSLLDLDTDKEPSPRVIQRWYLFAKAKQNFQIRYFEQKYGECPIFWKRLHKRKIDVFFTIPDNAVLIDLSTGELLVEPEFLNIPWKLDVKELHLERRRHLSAQVVSLLDGNMDAAEWKNEIMESVGFIPEHRQKVVDLFNQYSVNYCFEKEEFKEKVRIFGSPADIREIFILGIEEGILQ